MSTGIGYELRLADTADPAYAKSLITQLRDFALTKGFEEVGELMELPFYRSRIELERHILDADTGDQDDARFDRPEERAVFPYSKFHAWAQTSAEVHWNFHDPAGMDEKLKAYGFIVTPGDGYDVCLFGLAREFKPWSLQSELEDPLPWRWISRCKIYFEPKLGHEHFVRMQTSINATFDEAVRLGMEVEVFDDTMFWDDRDARRYEGFVKRWHNSIMEMHGRREKRKRASPRT